MLNELETKIEYGIKKEINSLSKKVTMLVEI